MELTEQQEATNRVIVLGEQEAMDQQTRWGFSDLRALFINCTLKRSPEVSNTRGLLRATVPGLASKFARRGDRGS
ncbi:MAG: hypothetical protein ABWZ15_01600 [Acidimicrobiia bacterium]